MPASSDFYWRLLLFGKFSRGCGREGREGFSSLFYTFEGLKKVVLSDRLLMMMNGIWFLTITLFTGCREFNWGEKFSYKWRLSSRKFLLASCDVGWRLLVFSKFSRGCWREGRGRFSS